MPTETRSVVEILAASSPETDPDREGIRVLLATAHHLLPGADLAQLVVLATTFHPRMREFDPLIVADVARRMLGLDVA